MATLATLVGTCCFRSYYRTRICINHDTATIGEVDIPDNRAILVLQDAVVNSAAGGRRESCLLGLLLSHFGLGREGCLVCTAVTAGAAAFVLARGFARNDGTGITVHKRTAAIGEVDVIDGRAVLILEARVVNSAAGVGGEGRLLGLLLGYLGSDRTRT